MLLSVGLLLIVGLMMATVAEKCRLPRLVGMLITGVVLGPQVLGLMDESLLLISGDLRKMALVLILLKAGLSLKVSEIKSVGKPALLLSFLPATCEMIGVTLLAQWLLGLSLWDAALLGAVLSAVSPAVVVPQMTRLMEEKRGTQKFIPQMLLAGSSMDDVYVIVVFSSFLALAQGGAVNAVSFLQIPVSIVLGLAVGAVVGILLSLFFQKRHMRDSLKVLIILGVGMLLTACESLLEGIVPFSGLLSVISMGMAIQYKQSMVADRLSTKCAKLWMGAEVMLFVLVGAALNIQSATDAGLASIATILLALLFRSVGTWVAVSCGNLTLKEKVFCLFAYIPKATVQAAIGSVPLAAGLACGQTVLSVAVVAILITAPLGAFLIEKLAPVLLEKND